MQFACGSRLEQPLRFALFHGEAQSPVTIGRLELLALQHVRWCRGQNRSREKQRASRVPIPRFRYGAQMPSPRLLVTASKIYRNKSLSMSIRTVKKNTHNGLPNCAM